MTRTNSLPPSYAYASGQTGGQPAGQPASQAMPPQPYRGYVSKCIQVTGILQLIAGSLSIVLGIAAAVLKAYMSYAACPIWGGLFLFIATGILGIVYHCKSRSKCIAVAYLVMSIICGVYAFCLFITYAIYAALEEEFDWNGYNMCHPLDLDYCYGPVWPRQLIDGLLVVVFFMEFVCGIIASSMACYKVCNCCRACCRCCCEEEPYSNVMYFSANGGAVPMVAIPANQANRPIYVANPAGNIPRQPAAPIMIMAQNYPQSATPVLQAPAQPGPQGQQFVAIQPPAQQPAVAAQPMQQVVNMPTQPYVAGQTPVLQATNQPKPSATQQTPALYPVQQYQPMSAYPPPVVNPGALAQAAPPQVAPPQAAPPQAAPTQVSSTQVAPPQGASTQGQAAAPEMSDVDLLSEEPKEIGGNQYSDKTALI